MSKLVLIRHGKTGYNIDKRFTGFTDVSITEDTGIENARTVAQKLKSLDIAFDHAHYSWLKRSKETLEIVLDDLQQNPAPELQRHPFLNERHYGDLQGLYHTEMIQKFGADQVQEWRRSYATRPPNGESLQDVVYRVTYYLENVIRPQLEDNKHVLVCAHGNSNRALVKLIEGISNEDIVKREIAYDEPIIYDMDGFFQ